MISRATIFRLTGSLGLARALLTARRLLPPVWLTVLAYHRVCEYDLNSPWDDELISATPQQFRDQLSFVKRYFTVITSKRVLEWQLGKRKLPRNPLVITFDDGYRDNHDVALPLLLEAGLSADFFVCSNNIEERCLFWWDRIAFCLRRTPETAVTLEYPCVLELDLRTPQAREIARTRILSEIKDGQGVDADRVATELQSRTHVDLDEPAEAAALLMSWGHVRALQDAGMGVGSHSHTHGVLSRMDEEAVREELELSKQRIGQVLGEEVFAFAYPVGRFSAATKRQVAAAGYRLAYSYCSGASALRSPDFLELKRVAVERFMSSPYYATLTALPVLC